MNTTAEIEIADLQKIDVRIGTILTCENVVNSEKLLKLEVDFGSLGRRQILTGMAKFYSAKELIGLQTAFVVNLKARKMMGLNSFGMVFAIDAGEGKKPVFLIPKDNVENGCKVL